MLSHNFGIEMSVSTLKRRLQDYDLGRKENVSEDVLRNVIADNINGPGSLRGYRGIWTMLRTTYNITARRDTVIRLLKEIDPVASEERISSRLQRRVYSSPGPNAVWHVGGYDKLKPYGFPIHGCVDGFSRKIIRLKVCKSNNNPLVPASFYLKIIEKKKFCPLVVRTDCGTENGILAAFQCTLRDQNAHQYGSSHRNQRIENWWSHNRRCFMAWVINFFKDLVDSRTMIQGNYFHDECAWFVFSTFLQNELDRVRKEWNNHSIRKSRRSAVSGIPCELYSFPQQHGFNECATPVTAAQIDNIVEESDVYNAASNALDVGDVELKEYLMYVINAENLVYPPHNWNDAASIFQKIIQISGC